MASVSQIYQELVRMEAQQLPESTAMGLNNPSVPAAYAHKQFRHQQLIQKSTNLKQHYTNRHCHHPNPTLQPPHSQKHTPYSSDRPTPASPHPSSNPFFVSLASFHPLKLSQSHTNKYRHIEDQQATHNEKQQLGGRSPHETKHEDRWLSSRSNAKEDRDRHDGWDGQPDNSISYHRPSFNLSCSYEQKLNSYIEDCRNKTTPLFMKPKHAQEKYNRSRFQRQSNKVSVMSMDKAMFLLTTD